MSKDELKELLKENLEISIDINKEDGYLNICASIRFDGDLISESNEGITLEASCWDED